MQDVRDKQIILWKEKEIEIKKEMKINGFLICDF